MSNDTTELESRDTEGPEDEDLEIKHLIQDDVVDSLSVLTGLSIGDVRQEISLGNFEQIAVKAFREFKFKYYRYYLGEVGDETELDTIKLLESALDSVELELQNVTDRRRRTELEREALEIRTAIQREKNND